MSTATDPPLTFQIDDSLPRSAVDVFDVQPDSAFYHPRRVGRGVKDRQWIPDAGASQVVVIAKDHALITKQSERAHLIAHSVCLFSLDGECGNLGREEIVEILARARPEITRLARSVPRPLLATVNRQSGITIDYPEDVPVPPAPPAASSGATGTSEAGDSSSPSQ